MTPNQMRLYRENSNRTNGITVIRGRICHGCGKQKPIAGGSVQNGGKEFICKECKE